MILNRLTVFPKLPFRNLNNDVNYKNQGARHFARYRAPCLAVNLNN